MKKIYCLIIIILTFASIQNIYAQNQLTADYKRWHYGAFVGMNMMDFGIKDNLESNLRAEIRTWIPGFSVGLIGEMRLNNYFNLRLAPAFHMGQYNVTFYEGSISSNRFHSNSIHGYKDVPSNIVRIPVYVRYNAVRLADSRPYILAGGGLDIEWNIDKDPENPILFKKLDYFTEFDRISKENEELRKQNEELKKLQADLEVLKEENAWLRDFLDIKNQNTVFDFTDAVIIGKNSGSSHRTFTLNKGSLHGITVGMVVISGEGLVGRINEVGLTTCEVICITDISSSIGALVERSAMIGIVDGYYEENCRFHYTTGFEDSSDIVVGDTVISSGKGSVYPYGLKIGTVIEVQLDDASRSVIATIQPSVDFDNLSRVMIIKSYTVE